MNKTLRISLITLGVFVIISLVIAFVIFFMYRAGGDNTVADNSGNDSSSGISGNVPVVSLNSNSSVNTNSAIESTEVTADDLEVIALYFTERFGSYSNHVETAYQNIEELYIYMTDDMKVWAEDYVAAEKEKDTSNDSYYGITTKALSAGNSIFDSDNGEASFIISTQRRENSADSGGAVIIYQDILIRFLEDEGVWKVAEARWQDSE